MLRMPLCDLLGIDHPIIQASIGPWTSLELTAAVSNAGAIGSIGTALRTPDQVRDDLARMRELTDRPYIVNYTMRPFDEEAFRHGLEAAPRVISMAIGRSRELVDRAHDAGCLFMQQIHTVDQAKEAAEIGVDVIIAQGGEAGGFSGTVAALPLVPQVVDAVAPTPVVAAGGIADGRGLAAALVLGAQGVNIGTRFMASEEASISEDWKRALVEAGSDEAIKIEFAGAVFPPAGEGGYQTLPRALRTPFIERGNADPEEIKKNGPAIGREMAQAVVEGRGHEWVPFTGQTVGMIHDVKPAAEIVASLVSDAEQALARAEAVVA
jgi:nitronate monooxygenase/enoyl-[acyl-carrier protein] reductase II